MGVKCGGDLGTGESPPRTVMRGRPAILLLLPKRLSFLYFFFFFCSSSFIPFISVCVRIWWFHKVYVIFHHYVPVAICVNTNDYNQ